MALNINYIKIQIIEYLKRGDIFIDPKIWAKNVAEYNKIVSEVPVFTKILSDNIVDDEFFYITLNNIVNSWQFILKEYLKNLRYLFVTEYNNRQQQLILMADEYNRKLLEDDLLKLTVDPFSTDVLIDKMNRNKI